MYRLLFFCGFVTRNLQLSYQVLFCSLGRNIYRILFKGRPMERNELFLPGRMAYVVDLEDEYADTDIPTTLIRSKADCPTMEVQTYNMGLFFIH